MKYFGPGCLAGITFFDWLELLAKNRFRVAPRYLGKAAFISFSSVFSSLLKPIEDIICRQRLAKCQLQSPLFIIGCWRSGTTHLHNLMCLDNRHSAPNLYQTMYPHTFLLTEFWWRPILNMMTPRKRFMDNMRQSLDEPHEDEMALANATQYSNMLSWAFPRNADHYDRFLDFQSATDQQKSEWQAALRKFVAKVASKTQKRVVLKSPNHTARIQLIREVFPAAKFLHIHRHPADVFRSMCHMVSQVQPVWGLQVLPPSTISSLVVETYSRLYDAFLDQRHILPAADLHEIRYDDLVKDPVSTLRDTYAALELTEFENLQPQLEEYVRAQAGYQRNRHTELDPQQRQALHDAWGKYCDLWSYDL